MGGLYEWCMWVVCMSGVYVATHDSTGRLRRQKVMAEMVKKQVMFIKVCVVVVVFVVVFIDVVVVVVVYFKRLRIVLRCAKAGCGRRTSSS